MSYASALSLYASILVGVASVSFFIINDNLPETHSPLPAWSTQHGRSTPEIRESVKRDTQRRISIYNNLLDDSAGKRQPTLLEGALYYAALKKLGRSRSAQMQQTRLYQSPALRRLKVGPSTESADNLRAALTIILQSFEAHGGLTRRLLESLPRGSVTPSPALNPVLNFVRDNRGLDVALPLPQKPANARQAFRWGLDTWLYFEALAVSRRTFAIIPAGAARSQLRTRTQILAHTDPDNIFFRYLRLRAADALSTTVRETLLTELINSQHFPKTRLPNQCDKKAPFHWAANAAARELKGQACQTRHSGIDFIWMASLLMEGTARPFGELIAH